MRVIHVSLSLGFTHLIPKTSRAASEARIYYVQYTWSDGSQTWYPLIMN